MKIDFQKPYISSSTILLCPLLDKGISLHDSCDCYPLLCLISKPLYPIFPSDLFLWNLSNNQPIFCFICYPFCIEQHTSVSILAYFQINICFFPYATAVANMVFCTYCFFKNQGFRQGQNRNLKKQNHFKIQI